MRRDKALRALVPHVRDEDIVVAVYQASFDWMAISPRPLNYVAVGAMGQASSHGLGLALANPDRKVLVFDGDGSLLMNLGSLVTIAAAGVRNFHHFLFLNRVYEVNGNHPLPGAGKTDFEGFARAAGYRDARTFVDLDEFENKVAANLQAPGPQMSVLDVVKGEEFPRNYSYIHSREARETFRKALNGRAVAFESFR